MRRSAVAARSPSLSLSIVRVEEERRPGEIEMGLGFSESDAGGVLFSRKSRPTVRSKQTAEINRSVSTRVAPTVGSQMDGRRRPNTSRRPKTAQAGARKRGPGPGWPRRCARSRRSRPWAAVAWAARGLVAQERKEFLVFFFFQIEFWLNSNPNLNRI